MIHNLVPLPFNDMNKDDYINALLAIYELNEVGPLLELFVDSYLRTCEQYQATAESFGFDAIRVRYRRERRAIIQEIITKQLHGDDMQKYIHQKSRDIDESDRLEFIKDIEEDLQEISSARIAGLGISQQELKIWLKRQV